MATSVTHGGQHPPRPPAPGGGDRGTAQNCAVRQATPPSLQYAAPNGRPGGSTEILVSEAYQWAFSGGNRYGYAAAYAVLIFGVLLLYSRSANKLAGRRVL